MNGLSRRWRAVVVPALVLPVLLPLVIRNWALIREASPIWLLMLGQALAVVACGIALAASLAALSAWHRRHKDANA